MVVIILIRWERVEKCTLVYKFNIYSNFIKILLKVFKAELLLTLSPKDGASIL